MEVVKHIVLPNGDQEWRRVNNYKLHREHDLPAIIWANGDQEWFINGERHRENDLPAIICTNGDQLWYINGLRHRDNDLPAIIYADGHQSWYINGKMHRENNKPSFIGLKHVAYYTHGVKTKTEPYNSENHDRFKFISGRKTKAVNFHVQVEHEN